MNSLILPLVVGTGGFVGAVLRHYVTLGVTRVTGSDHSFVGTLTVNLIGCFAIGVLTTLSNRAHISPMMHRYLITGLLGSLTTFSTFGLDVVNLLQAGRSTAAIISVTMNVLPGLLLVWLGLTVADRWLPPSAHEQHTDSHVEPVNS
ncbi:MAG: fluoride efflux transporter CrcB [Planctomycetaceae bacterium]